MSINDGAVATAKAGAPAATTVNVNIAAGTDLHHIVTKLRKQKKVAVQISPMYRPYFGRVMTVGLCGANIYVPVNNSKHKIPKDMAAIVNERIARVDAFITRTNRMSNVQANHESYAGEINL